MKFLENHLDAKSFIRFKEMYSDSYLDFVNNRLKVNEILIDWGVNLSGKGLRKEVLTEFIDFLLNIACPKLSKCGVYVKFENGEDSALVPLSFDKKGKPNKFFLSIGIYGGETNALYNIAHEVTHMYQYITKELEYRNNQLFYKGKVIPTPESTEEYLQLDYELDAYGNEEDLVRLYKEDYCSYVLSEKTGKESFSYIDRIPEFFINRRSNYK